MLLKTALAVALAVFSLSACSDKPRLIEQQILEFGTIIRVTLVSEDVKTAEHQLTTIEDRLRLHRHYWHAWEDSDLSQFNRSLKNTKAQQIPQSLQTLLNLSKHYYQKSGGLFNPALGKLIAAYGFHAKSEPQTEIINLIKQDLPTMDDLDIENQTATSHNPYLALDLGAIAKGYSIAETAKWLTNQGIENFLINAGGDLVSSGNRGTKPWNLGIQNPFAPGVIAGLSINSTMALFTSGNYQRFYRKGGKIIHHIIDPRTGEPSTRIASATVLHDDPVLADVASTTLMIDGLDNHLKFASSLGIKDYLIISEDRKIIVTQELNEKLQWLIDWPKEIVVTR